MVAVNRWPLTHMDVTNAFFQGDLDEDIYKSVPQGYKLQGEHDVFKLRKSLYGLRQASRQ